MGYQQLAKHRFLLLEVKKKTSLDHYEKEGNFTVIGLVALFLFLPPLCVYLSPVKWLSKKPTGPIKSIPHPITIQALPIVSVPGFCFLPHLHRDNGGPVWSTAFFRRASPQSKKQPDQYRQAQ